MFDFIEYDDIKWEQVVSNKIAEIIDEEILKRLTEGFWDYESQQMSDVQSFFEQNFK